ncbi:hypothetical protein BDV32DRAFT_153952 [Aspergillus pseudonomiae]|uniref:Uncharacterized protein n=1 Tax=Aspergillus pseudonomiae TaxID=1506151 RepID=A0A5N6HPQ0_9EURO|nr:uncharacterized protein BDV37DRAFT_285589 [Aspergillus pseudonomiae]KAB8255814.1 hypothetical protein BDV32DRAFT_153952 [Aspergillus pseudonomiae]KAE8401568.1 hypothetical protein BDV37DRAFT_285589 [Aspergillus pseudonomiae]
MNFLLLLFVVFFAPLLLLLGRSLRSRFTQNSLREGMDAYGRDYLRGMAGSGPAMSEQIELEDMLRDSDHEE